MEHFKANYTYLFETNKKTFDEANRLCNEYFEARKKEKDTSKTSEYKAFSELRTQLKNINNNFTTVTKLYETTDIHLLTFENLKLYLHTYYEMEAITDNVETVKKLTK